MRKLRRHLRATGSFVAYLIGAPATAYGVVHSIDGHPTALTGIPLVIAGIALCVPRRVELAQATRERRDNLLMLCVRVHPGHTAAWIGKELDWKPGQLYPMLERLVEAGELVRAADLTYWTVAAPKVDPDWAAKREAS